MVDFIRINEFLNEMERELGDKFTSRFYLRIDRVDGSGVTISALDRGNGLAVSTVTVDLSLPPAEAAQKFAELK